MKINIFGSTGMIGSTALNVLKNKFPEYKVNLLCANNNIKLLVKQSNKFSVKYVYLDNERKRTKLKSLLSKDVKILDYEGLQEYLCKSKSDLSLLCVSGYHSLKYLKSIIINTNIIGIVSKEAIVSAGHILKKLAAKYKTEIFPLDSEHFSIFQHFNNLNLKKYDFKKIYLTASGGPFFGKSFNSLKNVTFAQATKHPKWKMGYKNSIDSATLVNKCLELIEAHYLFDIPFAKLDILIHPQSLVHSIIEEENYLSKMIYFQNDMKIPLINFFNFNILKKLPILKKYNLISQFTINFSNVHDYNYPIFKYFKLIDKTNPCNLIKFNVGNEYAVDLFKQKKIKYIEIFDLIKEITSLNIDSDVNNIDNIIQYHEKLNQHIKFLF